jgi:hypothetical protein
MGVIPRKTLRTSLGQLKRATAPHENPVDRPAHPHVNSLPIMGDSEFAAKDDLQSVRDVVYEHAQKLDELTQKIEALSQKLDQMRPEDVVNDWSSLYKLLNDNSSTLGDLVMQTSSVASKFNNIDSTLSDIKSKVGS